MQNSECSSESILIIFIPLDFSVYPWFYGTPIIRVGQLFKFKVWDSIPTFITGNYIK